MKVGSLFSGVGGMDLGLERAGHEVAFQVEKVPWRRDILAHHWPKVPRFDDVRGFTGEGLSVDMLCGGFPCQDVSIAGKRAGFGGERSSLFFDFARIADALRPAWLLIENVPGLLTSRAGRDFGIVLSTLVELGYGLAWRILDSQHFGVPQRRRRVFIAGCLGARSPEPFLPFLEGCGGDSPAIADPQEDIAGPLGGGAYGAGRRSEDDPDLAYTVTGNPRNRSQGPANYVVANTLLNPGRGGGIRAENTFIARTITQGGRIDGDSEDFIVSHALTSGGHDASEDGTGRGTPIVVETADTLRGLGHGNDSNMPGRVAASPGNLVAYRKATKSHGAADDSERWEEAERADTLDASGNATRTAHAVIQDCRGIDKAQNGAGITGPGPAYTLDGQGAQGVGIGAKVRRLTTRECLRLQGFPDDWLGPPNEQPDAPRYAAVGDAVTVPVAEWIGRRIG